MINKVEICGVNTAKLPVLSNEEKEALFIEIKNGDEKAREKFIHGNLRLVLSVIKRFYGRGENVDDLFQVGCIGLIKAIDNFDVTLNVQFSTYAVPMIVGEIRRYLRDNNSIRVSRSVKDLAYKALKLKEELTMEDNSEPTTERLAELLEVEPYNIVNALESMRDPISIFEPIYNDGGDTIYLFDQIEDRKTDNSNIDTKMSVHEAISNLSRREQLVLEERFVIGKTQMEISEELGISQAQVSRIEKGIIDSLREKLR